MAAVTIWSDFGAQENKACHCFQCFPINLPWNSGMGCHDLHSLNVEFKPAFTQLGLPHMKHQRVLLVTMKEHQTVIQTCMKVLVKVNPWVIIKSSIIITIATYFCFLIATWFKRLYIKILLVYRTFLVVRLLRILHPLQGTWVQSLVGKLRSRCRTTKPGHHN